jgi:adenylylsulfate kinase-like enzyme
VRPEAVPVLLITGPPVVGKTSVASEISHLLNAQGVAHAEMDLDALSWCFPAPAGDPFRRRLALANLSAVWANFAKAGATRLVMAHTIETANDAQAIALAVPGADVTVVRLRADAETLAERVRRRELGSGLERHLRRAAEVASVVEQAKVGHFVVDTTGRAVAEVAAETLEIAGWTSSQ